MGGLSSRIVPFQRIVPFHTFIWKISSRCNINCSYCFVYNLADTRWKLQPALMSDDVAKQAAFRIREHCEANSKDDVSIVFHGGEPLLGGVEHLRCLTSIIEDTFRGSGVSVKIGLQSNGLLFTNSIGDLLLDKQVKIGISLDGPPEVNDVNRVDHLGRPTSRRLERQLEVLLSPRYRSIFGGFLCVINPNADPISVTNYLLSFAPLLSTFFFLWTITLDYRWANVQI